MTLDEIFSQDNMTSYARACKDLAMDIPTCRKDKPFDTLVIPSRGAVPFFLGMIHALGKLKEYGGEHDEFYNRIALQPMLDPFMPCGVKFPNVGSRDNEIKVLLAPFTADLNIGRFDSQESNDEYIRKTREYWAHVTAALCKPIGERELDPYFKSYTDVVLRGIERRGNLADIYETFPQMHGFAMIDTVISGRASNDILQAFDAIAHDNGDREDMMPDAFLIVDEDGRKLKKHFAAYLDTKKDIGQVRSYKVSRIVSEDEGPSLLGISAVVYPSVMKDSKHLELNHREFFVGAGSWIPTSELPDQYYFGNFQKFMGLVYRAIDFVYENEVNEDPAQMMAALDSFNTTRREFVRYFDENGVLTTHDSNMGIESNLRYVVENSYVTNSGVVHRIFNKNSTRRITQDLSSLNGVTFKGTSSSQGLLRHL